MVCNFIKKEILTQAFSCEFCEIFQNNFFTEHLWTTLMDDSFLKSIFSFWTCKSNNIWWRHWLLNCKPSHALITFCKLLACLVASSVFLLLKTFIMKLFKLLLIFFLQLLFGFKSKKYHGRPIHFDVRIMKTNLCSP